MDKSHLGGFVGLGALATQTANRAAAGEHPRVHREAKSIGKSLRGGQSRRKMPNTTALDFQRGDIQMTAGLHNQR